MSPVVTLSSLLQKQTSGVEQSSNMVFISAGVHDQSLCSTSLQSGNSQKIFGQLHVIHCCCEWSNIYKAKLVSYGLWQAGLCINLSDT